MIVYNCKSIKQLPNLTCEYNNNIMPEQKEDDLFEEFLSPIFTFDNVQQKHEQKQREDQKSQKGPQYFLQKMNKSTPHAAMDYESFLDSIFLDDNNKQVHASDIQTQRLFRQSPQPQDSCQSSQKLQPHPSKRTLDRTQMNRVYTKNYRLKKKEELQCLKEENRFLKQKIDDLTFRLREAELEINKLKHAELNLSANFNSMKEECIKQLQHILSADDTASFTQVYDLDQKFRDLVAFSNKPRLEMLNYLMSELLQNLISDQGMYFIECMQNKTGIWGENKGARLKKLDCEILEIMNGPLNEIELWDNVYRRVFEGNEHSIMREMVKIKMLWKKLYQDYLDIINQGMKLETVYRPLFEKKMLEKKDWILTSLKLKLFFQRNKYRKDIREIRQSWFRQIQEGKTSQAINPQPTIAINPQKRCKTSRPN